MVQRLCIPFTICTRHCLSWISSIWVTRWAYSWRRQWPPIQELHLWSWDLVQGCDTPHPRVGWHPWGTIFHQLPPWPGWTHQVCLGWGIPWGSHWLLYIIFIKFFLPIIPMFRFRSWRLPSLCTDYSSTCYTFCIYTYFWLQVFFYCSQLLHALLFTLPHAFTFLSMCSDSVHKLFQVTMTFYIFMFILVILPTYPDAIYINRCIFLVVLQFVNWHWFISSPIFSLSLLYLLKSLSSLSSLSSSSGNYIFTKTKLRPSHLMSWLLTNSRTTV